MKCEEIDMRGMLLILLSTLAIFNSATAAIYPARGLVQGGNSASISFAPSELITEVKLGNHAVTDISFSDFNENDPTADLSALFTVPPGDALGPVDVVVSYMGTQERVFATYTYVDSPEVFTITPDVHSTKPDSRVFRMNGDAFAQGATISIGDNIIRGATLNSYGTEFVLVPPPMSRNAAPPVSLNITVTNPDGKSGTLINGITYEWVVPSGEIFASPVYNAWHKPVTDYVFDSGNLVPPVSVLVGNVRTKASVDGIVLLKVVLPPFPPGQYDLTVVNADGGTYSVPDAIKYVGTPSTYYHTADTDKDFRISLQEVLRAAQFYNSGGYHCDAATEDGYAPGPGNQTCAPSSSDYAPQDWQINLDELLQLIQFYNFGIYRPCGSEDPSGFCPPYMDN